MRAGTFFEKYSKAVMDKQSYINLNLDPALPRQRNTLTIPERFMAKSDRKALLDFSVEIIEEVGDYCCSVKPNTQYFLGAFDALREVVHRIHDHGMIAILDHKLSDIGATNESAVFWIADMGFDAYTYSPFPGNIEETVRKSHDRGLGVIVLTLMSNPEAEALLVDTKVAGYPYYLNIARAVAKSKADGCVIGLTGYVKSEFIKKIQDIVGDKVIFLLQGLGPQGGELIKSRHVKNPLFSLGREIMYSENPKRVAKKYCEKFRHYRVVNGN